MKFVHTADLHLGYRQYGFREREADFISAADQVGDIAIREKADAVVIAGDIFDTPRPPAVAVEAAKDLGARLRTAGIPVYTIDGNHDMVSGHWASICGFVPLRPDMPAVELGGLRIHGVDYCSKAHLLERLKAMADSGIRLDGGVLMLHAEIAEMSAYSTAMSLEELEPLMDALDVGYVALGHIHNRVTWQNPAGRLYVYPGSTEANDTSEIGVKSVDVVEFDPVTRKYDRTSLSLATRRFEVLDIATAGEIDEKLRPALDDRDTFWLVKVDVGGEGAPVKRVPELLQGRLYRILPYGNRTLEEKAERSQMVIGLKDAIYQFFDRDSDEASLVAAMIETPDQVKQIAEEYVKSKEGVRNEQE